MKNQILKKLDKKERKNNKFCQTIKLNIFYIILITNDIIHFNKLNFTINKSKLQC